MTDTAARPAEPAPEVQPGPTVTIDGRQVAVEAGELVIDVAERAGVFIPRFCYHPRMDPVGMCRMCLVEVSGPRGFSLQPACYVRVSDGLEVVTASPKARKAQEGVLEFLLVNHPLDCPVCDKGGECPLQDQALSHGPGESRFVEEKRHFEKPIEIGPLVLLDRERCIQCARCTRFAAEVAGEAQIDFAGRGDLIEVAPFPTEPFSSYFSGNTVQICPVGALTSLPYRFKSRPWDLEQVETTCTTCSFGCRVAAQSSAGELVRYLGIDSDPVNQSWLCDRGRYGFEAINAPDRLTAPLVRRAGELVPARWHEALREVVAGVRQAHAQGGGSIGVIGGARLTNEDAYAWSRLARAALRTDSVDAQLGDGLPAEAVLGLPRATIEQAVSAKAVLVLSGDLREEIPVLFLRLRAAAAHRGLRLVECSPVPSALSAVAAARLAYRPGEEAALVDALLSGTVEDGGRAGTPPAADAGQLAEARRLLGLASATGGPATAADGGVAGDGVVVVLGRPSLATGEEAVSTAAARLAEALPGARFLLALRRSNVFGALDMGLAPGILPGRVDTGSGRAALEQVWGELPAGRGSGCRQILEAAAAGELSMLVLLAADPLADFPDAELARRALDATPFVVALGTHPDASNRAADVVLPIAGADERLGTTTNLEGRLSMLAQKVVPPGVAWPAWTVASELAARLGADFAFESVEDIWVEIERVAPSHRGVSWHLLSSLARRDGVVVPIPPASVSIRSGASGGGTPATSQSPSGAGAGQRGVGGLAGSPAGAGAAAQAAPGRPAGTTATGGGGDGDSGGGPPGGGFALRPIDPIATPGIVSVEEQGAPLRAGAALPAGSDPGDLPPGDLSSGAPAHGQTVPAGSPASAGGAVAAGSAPSPPARPGERASELLSWPPAGASGAAVPGAAPLGDGLLRLVVRRRLYDAGTLVAASPSLAGLAEPPRAVVHPDELAARGITGTAAATGRLAVPGRDAALSVELRADPAVPPGLAVLDANPVVPAGEDGVTSLLRAGEPVVDVSLEVLG